ALGGEHSPMGSRRTWACSLRTLSNKAARQTERHYPGSPYPAPESRVIAEENSGMNIGIVGLGYVGLPLGVAFAEAGHEVVGLDTDARRIAAVTEGESYIEDVSSDRLRSVSDRLRATARYADLSKAEAVVSAVPTPLTR